LRLTGKKLALLLLLLAAASATLVASPISYGNFAVGLTLYAVVLVVLMAHCAKTTSIRELNSVILLVVLSSSIGASLGVLISQTLLSVMTATSMCVFLLVYALIATRWYK
jgi:hypothetical protein